MRESKASKKNRILEILSDLRRTYPNATSSLDFRDPFQLLVAVILSAQCTDERINKIAPKLFAKYPDALALSKASEEDLIPYLKSVTYFRQKARSIREMSRQLVESFDGKVPSDLEKLTSLRGVGRKSANVIRGVIFQIPALVVDTHVKRLSRRLGMTLEEDPDRIEQDLANWIPISDWIDLAHWLIDHGRSVCKARNPDCHACMLSSKCPKKGVVKAELLKTRIKRASLDGQERESQRP